MKCCWSWLMLTVHLLACAPARATVTLTVGQSHNGTLAAGQIETVTLDLGKNASDQLAVRLSTLSLDANLSQPVLVSVRQGRHISSWMLPYVEAGNAVLEVDRTLCPILNSPLGKHSSDVIYIDFSTSSSNNVSFSVSTAAVLDYELTVDSPVSVAVFPLSTVYYVFEYPAGMDSIRVKVKSEDDTGDLCAIVSVQDGLCPNDQLVDYPEHRGTFQTMLELAAINYHRPAHQDYVYVVVSTFPGDGECSDNSLDLVDGLITLNLSANYNPIINANISERAKTITIVVETTLSVSGYVLGMTVPVAVFGSVFFVSLLWILVFDYFCYKQHKAYSLLSDIDHFKKREENELSDEQTDGHVNISTDEEPGRNARPNPLRLLLGQHWSHELDRRTSPSPKTPHYIEKAFMQAFLRQRPKEQPSFSRSISFPVQAMEHSPVICMRRSNTQNERSCSPLLEPDTDNHLPAHLETMFGSTVNSVSENGTDDTDGPERNVYPAVERGNGDMVCRPMHLHLNQQQSHEIATTSENQTDTLADDQTSSSASKPMEPKNKQVVIPVLNQPQKMSELSFPEGKAFQERYRGYWAYLIAIVLFYAIPTYQLVLTYQRYINYSGNQDFCYYNTLCSHPLGSLSAFNNIWSNIGFVMMGVLFLLIIRRRQYQYRFYELYNETLDKLERQEQKIGVPHHFGIYYAIGMSLIGEGIMSAAYHICPTSSNYQFDTTLMLVMAALGLYKLYECRNPDTVPPSHGILLSLGFVVLLVGIGVLYPGNLVFYVLFFVVFECGVIIVTIENYYRWKLKIWNISEARMLISEWVGLLKHPWPPANKLKFAYLIFSNAVNFLCAIYGIIFRPSDFATYFLAILIINFLSSLFYYGIAKIVRKEYIHRKRQLLRPAILFALSVMMFTLAVIMYLQSVTNWLVSPAVSRNANAECVLLGFFDTHDLWHILTAFGLFFAFLMMTTLDDNEKFVLRSQLHIF